MQLSHVQAGRDIIIAIGTRARRAAAGVAPITAATEPTVGPGGSGFVGRTEELQLLLNFLTPATAADDDLRPGSGVAVVSAAVAGTAGVGKTALALHAAREAVRRGWFPGGAVWVDLRGYDPDPDEQLWPAQLSGELLRGLGLPPELIPVDEAGQATAYHQWLTALDTAGRGVLIVLDNVADPDQVTGLLPGGRAHRVLITSRDTLAQLPARPVEISVLEVSVAVALLQAALHARRPADRRLVDDPAAAEELARVCGGLPLALQIVAALLAEDPDRPVTGFVMDLRDERTRLAALAYGPHWAVRAALDLSYLRLTPELALLFRLLAAVPGPDVGIEVAAAVTDAPAVVVRARLQELTRAHLLERRTHGEDGDGRWGMHDLVGLYAADLVTTTELVLGFGRVVEHYRAAAVDARARLTARIGQDPHECRFTTVVEVMTWLRHERPGVVATTVIAATQPDHEADCLDIAEALGPVLDRARYLQDGIAVATAALTAALTYGDRHEQAVAWNNVGLALREVRRFELAIAALRVAGDIYREVGDRRAEGQVWGNLGSALQEMRRSEEALAAHQRDLNSCRELGDRRGEGMAWNSLGTALQQVWQFEEAIAAHRRAADIHRETGDRHGEGRAWNNLGAALMETGRGEEAIAAHRRAADIYRETGDRHGEGQAWGNLGIALMQTGQGEKAISTLRLARDIFREVGDRHGEGQLSNNLGFALQQARRFEEAIAALRLADDIFHEVGDRHGQGTVSISLGLALHNAGQIQRARQAWRDALAILEVHGADHEVGMLRAVLAGLDEQHL